MCKSLIAAQDRDMQRLLRQFKFASIVSVFARTGLLGSVQFINIRHEVGHRNFTSKFTNIELLVQS